MSIAVSTVVKPSRYLLMLVCGMCAVTLWIGALVGTGKVGDLSVIQRCLIAIFCIFLAFFGLYHTVRHQKHLHIDISGAGLVRLTEISDGGDSCEQRKWPHLYEDGEVVRLLDDSTIWSCLMLLRLKADTGKITVLMILTDSVSRDSFRALSVACRWIAAHNNSSEHTV